MYLCRVLLEKELSAYKNILDFCQELYDKRIRSPYLMGYMVDFYESQLEGDCEDRKDTLEKTLKVLF